jgi:hypothetical protein
VKHGRKTYKGRSLTADEKKGILLRWGWAEVEGSLEQMLLALDVATVVRTNDPAVYESAEKLVEKTVTAVTRGTDMFIKNSVTTGGKTIAVEGYIFNRVLAHEATHVLQFLRRYDGDVNSAFRDLRTLVEAVGPKGYDLFPPEVEARRVANADYPPR